MSYLRIDIQSFWIYHQGSWHFEKYSLYKNLSNWETSHDRRKQSWFLSLPFLSYFLLYFYQVFHLRKPKLWNKNTFKSNIRYMSWHLVTISKQNTLMKLKLVNPKTFQVSGRKYRETAHFHSRCSIKGNPGHQKTAFPNPWKKYWKGRIYF